MSFLGMPRLQSLAARKPLFYNASHFKEIAAERVGRVTDGNEILRGQRSPPDQPAIDIRHREEVRRIIPGHTPPIQNPYIGSNCGIASGNPVADEGMHLLRLLWRRRSAGTNSPQRLVCQDGATQYLGAEAADNCIQLPTDDVFGPIRFPLLMRLAHAENRHQSHCLRRKKARRSGVVGFVELAAALGMPDDNMRTTVFDQHVRRHRTGQRIIPGSAQILSPPPYIAAL